MGLRPDDSLNRPSAITEPIIVLGAPRSGTTLVASLLAAHPEVAVIGEPRLVWRYGNDARSDELRPEHATPAVVEHIHGAFGRMLAERGAARLVEKTPANALRPAFVDTVFPDARFVHITRNGWGAVPSMRDFWKRRAEGMDRKQVAKLGRRLREAQPSQVLYYAGELLGRLRPLLSVLGGRSPQHAPLYGPRLAGLQQVVDELGHLAASAVQWQACVERAASFGRSLPPERYVEVRLEDLDADRMAGVVAFCGLGDPASVLRRHREVYRADAARRRAPLDPGERAIVAPYVESVNAWLGYRDDAVAPTDLAAGTGQ